MPKGIYDRKKARSNAGMFKRGKRSSPELVRKRVLGIMKSRKLREKLGKD